LSLISAGDREGARAVAEQGLARADHGEESYMAGELAILLAQLEDDRGRAAMYLRKAMMRARAQGSLTVALRASALLLRLLDDASYRDAAQLVLGVLDGNVPVPEDPEFVRVMLAHFEAGIAAATLTSDEPVVHLQVH
jgi:hypothetical protein